MNQKPLHYDGSLPFNNEATTEAKSTEAFELTDEMRKNIGGNPYIIDATE